MVSRNVGFRFSIVSYNILAQNLLSEHQFLYTDCNPQDLEWPRRGHKILSELLDNQADIICLQEVQSTHLNSLFRPRLARHGYQCLYKKKTGYKIDGCAIFFKRKLFHLLDCKCIEFKRTDLNSLLDRDNVGLIAVLRPKPDCNLVIANTHLLFNPNRDDIKMAQLKYFLSELETVSFKTPSNLQSSVSCHPTILCGDLNSLPNSEVVQLITKNSSNNRQSHEINNQRESHSTSITDFSHKLKFKSVYPVKNRFGKHFVSTFSHCIVDYMFYTPQLRLESFRELLTEEEMQEMGPIPNLKCPSDHISLEAEFSIR